MNRAELLVTFADDPRPDQLDADVLVVPVFERDDLADLPWLGPATGGEVARAIESGEIRGKLFEWFVTPVVGAGWRPRRVAVFGGGPADEFVTDRARRVAAAAMRWARDRRIGRLGFLERRPRGRARGAGAPVPLTVWVQAIAEGLVLGHFDPGTFKTADRLTHLVRSIVVAAPDGSSGGADLAGAVERGRVLGEASNLARELANEPGGARPPREFVRRAAALVPPAVSVEVLDERRLADLGMRLILGVGQGSHEPPRLLVLRHDPPGAPAAQVLGLVGKGITFDAGGISIKPADGMARMKGDCAGGAAVVAAMRALSLLGAPIRVIGVVPVAENMPGGGAMRPGDVVTSASGTTVEILDTDAEGRLVLADGLWYARTLGATHLVDVATLTGACTIALGTITAGLLGRPASWVDHVRRVADEAGDRCWVLPLHEDYREQLKSDVADLTNTGGRPAGAITAAMFLAEFTARLPWAHLDIAGTAWNDELRPDAPKGPTGAGVRTLAGLALTSIAAIAPDGAH